jgi:hypothetical protein
VVTLMAATAARAIWLLLNLKVIETSPGWIWNAGATCATGDGTTPER